MYVLFFSQSQFQMLPDIFSANHIVGLHLIRPFYPITLQEPLWNRWLQFITNVCLFVSFGVFANLTSILICMSYKLQYCSLFSLFSYFLNSVKKSVCTWTRKKNITFLGFFVSRFFLFTTIAYIQGTYSFLFIFAPFIPFLLVVMQRANLIICEPLVQTRLGLLQKLTRNFKTL